MTSIPTTQGSTAPSKDSVALQRYESTLGKVYRKVFNDRPELSIRVRVLIAVATIWASLTLFAIGVSPVIPLLTIPATIVGHWVATKAIQKRMPWISMMIAGTIIVAGVMMRFELVEALQGNRIPVANFLLIAGAASVFDARTRAGLYTQLVFSGLVMFFAAEKAFGNEFVGLLGGYMAIVVILFATAQYVDLTSKASVRGLNTRFGSGIYWFGAALAVTVASFVSFMILPWDTSQTPQAARAAFLPVNGQDSPLPNINPQDAQSLLDQQTEQGQQPQIDPDLFAQDGSVEGGEFGSDFFGTTAEGQGAIDGKPLTGEIGGGDRVAYVRSAVASYWRGRVYDTFDPEANSDLGMWYSTVEDDRRFRGILSNGRDSKDTDKYLQTWFLQQDLGTNILTGYEPLAIAVPKDNRGRISLTPGSTYQVVSKQPETDPDILRRDRAEWISKEYGTIPAGHNELQQLAFALTKDAENDFDKASALTSYLQNLEYDDQAESPLQPSTDLKRFIIGELPGTAIDFAGALTLMARSAGLQSRVATGYLPGEYNSYSGASKVTPQDAHAWSEIYFRGAGWIPFDASTRADLPTPAELEAAPPTGLSSLLDRRLGDSLAAAAGQTPSAILKGFEFAMKNGIGWGLFALAGVGFTSMLVWFLFFYRKKGLAKPIRFDYLSIDGSDRKAIIAAFNSVEKHLAKNGFRRRQANESYREYAFGAQLYAGDHVEALDWLAGAASKAAFSSAAIDTEETTTAFDQANDLRSKIS
jgi:transglutaminase-like putative cysteine protease